MRDTRLGSRSHFEARGFDLDIAQIGMTIMKATLSPQVGPETILVLKEQRSFFESLMKLAPLSLMLNSGAARTSAGPIFFALWWFPPMTNNRPYAAYETFWNPMGDMAIICDAAEQSHLHLVILDEAGEIIDVVEFENNYNLSRMVELALMIQSEELCAYNFEMAKSAFTDELELDDLFAG